MFLGVAWIFPIDCEHKSAAERRGIGLKTAGLFPYESAQTG